MKSISGKLTIAVIMLALLSASVACQQSGQSEQQSLVPDPGVVSWSLRNQFQEDVPGTLDFIRDIGIRNIEFSSLFGLSAEELRALLDERGLYARSYGVSYDAIKYDLELIVEDATALGAKYVRVANIPRSGMFTLEMAQEAVERFNNA